MRKHGKLRVFYAVIYSGILFSGGCHSDDCRHIRDLQERIMTPGEPLPRRDKTMPEGVRDNTQWIPPKASGEVGPAV